MAASGWIGITHYTSRWKEPKLRQYFGPDICYLTLYCHPPGPHSALVLCHVLFFDLGLPSGLNVCVCIPVMTRLH